MCMPKHDDIRHFQSHDRIFQRGTGAVKSAIFFHRRHQIGNVADHKNLTGLGAENKCRIDAGIRTRNHHGAWTLTVFYKLRIPMVISSMNPVFKTIIASQHPFNWHGQQPPSKHQTCASTAPNHGLRTTDDRRFLQTALQHHRFSSVP